MNYLLAEPRCRSDSWERRLLPDISLYVSARLIRFGLIRFILSPDAVATRYYLYETMFFTRCRIPRRVRLLLNHFRKVLNISSLEV